jgi:hypothetical protein
VIAELSAWLVPRGPFDLLAAAPTAPPITRDGAQRAAQGELSKRAYHAGDPSTPNRVLQWLLHKIGNAVDAASRHAPGKGIGLLVIVVLLIVAVTLIGARLGRVRRTATATFAVFGTEVVTAHDHRERAQAYAAEQQWAQAVREWLRATVRELEERGVLDPRPGRTASELCVEASAALPGIADELRRATSAFDAIWYGGRPASSDDEQLLRALDRRVAGSHRALATARAS